MGDRGGNFVPSSTDVRRQGELNFLFSTCLVDEGSVISVALPLVFCDFSNVFSEDLIELPPHREMNSPLILYRAPRPSRYHRIVLHRQNCKS